MTQKMKSSHFDELEQKPKDVLTSQGTFDKLAYGAITIKEGYPLAKDIDTIKANLCMTSKRGSSRPMISTMLGPGSSKQNWDRAQVRSWVVVNVKDDPKTVFA
jgi:hypothetical protein